MSNLSLVTTPNRPDTDTEVVLEGIDYPSIKPGQYEANLVSYETSTRFAKKVPGDNSYMEGGVKSICILESTPITMQDWVIRKSLSSCHSMPRPSRGHSARTENLQPLDAVTMGN